MCYVWAPMEGARPIQRNQIEFEIPPIWLERSSKFNVNVVHRKYCN